MSRRRARTAESTGLSFHPGNAAWAVLPRGSGLQLGCGHELPLTRPGRLAATRGGVGVLARRTVPAAERARHPSGPGQRRNQGILIGIVIAVVFAIAGLVIFGIVAKSTGAGGFTWGLVFAFVPVIPVIALYLWLDRYEPEPTKYILFALCWGAFIATLAAIFINTEVSHWLARDRQRRQPVGRVRRAAGGGVREGIVILLLALLRRKEFDGIIDGLVYAGMVGVGFAFTENILYYGRIFNQLSEEAGSDAGLRGAFVLFVIRGLISPFAHPLFTSFTAIGIGIAVRHRSTAVRFLAPVVGYLAAVLAHGLWNGGASWAGGGGFITVYLFLMVPIFIGMVVFALVMRSREGQMIASRLYDYVRFGWLVPQDVPLIATLRGRKALRQNAKRYGAAGRSRREGVPAERDRAGLPAGQDRPPGDRAGRAGDREAAARRAAGPAPERAVPADAGVRPGRHRSSRCRSPRAVRGLDRPVPGGPSAWGPVSTARAGYRPAAGWVSARLSAGYPSGQPGYPAGQPGYPPGPPGQQGPPGGYGPYPPSQ